MVIEMIKPDKDVTVLLYYKLCIRNEIDWKTSYFRRCMFDGKVPVLQGEMSDEYC